MTLAWHRHSSLQLLCSDLSVLCSNVEIAALSESLLLSSEAIISVFVEFNRVAESGCSQITGQKSSRITRQSQTALKRRRFLFLLMMRKTFCINWTELVNNFPSYKTSCQKRKLSSLNQILKFMFFLPFRLKSTSMLMSRILLEHLGAEQKTSFRDDFIADI